MTKVQKNTLIVSVTTAFITSFTASALNLSIPSIGAEFNVSASLLGWVVTVYAMAACVLTVPFGRLADITGRKRILVTGISTFAASSLIAALSVNFLMVMVARVFQGLSASMIFATNQAIIVSTFPGGERGRALGISISSTYTGIALGPVLGGIINNYLGWRFIFWFMVIFASYAATVAVRWLPSEQMNKDAYSKFDLKGNILFISMMFSLMFGLCNMSYGWYSYVLIAIGLILGVVFVRVESKEETPVIKVSMFKNKPYAYSNIATFLNYTSTFVISYLLSIYLQVIQGFSSQTAGLIMISQPVVMALLSPQMGKLSDKISPFKLATAGMGFCACGLFMLTFLNLDTGVWYIVVLLVLSGIGFAVFSSPNTNAVMSLVRREDFGVATSILNTMRNMGQNVCMAIITIVVSMRLGTKALAEATPVELISTMRILFIIFTCTSVLGIFFSMGRSIGKHQD